MIPPNNPDPHRHCIDRAFVDDHIRRHTEHTTRQIELLKAFVENTFGVRPIWSPLDQLFYFEIPDGRVMQPGKPLNDEALKRVMNRKNKEH